MEYKKPQRLRKGDIAAVVSPSWGGPSVFPAVYESGLRMLREWGLEIREYPSARAPADVLQRDPRMRAQDINDAFRDKEVKAVIASIGGDDSVRVLPYLDGAAIANNPKILMGYSDTTTLLAFGNLQGIVTFHGPSIMAGFAQMGSLPAAAAHAHEMLFGAGTTYAYAPYQEYCDGYPDWSQPENAGKVNPLQPHAGWRVIQGGGTVRGQLFGGCIEVLEFLKGTEFWPNKEFWDGKLLFFETSEEKPPIEAVRRMLRNYGIQGAFDRIAGILIGRARDYSEEEKLGLDAALIDVVAGEFGSSRVPIVTNMDFGHTDPQHILPLGVEAELDCGRDSLTLTEPWLEA